MSLNPAQAEAVRTLRGPLLVLAGAGTGKTRVVTHRIAELIKHRTTPSRILAVTFTNKAAAEMQERAASLLGKRSKDRPEISTFHSLCVRILRRQIEKLGYPKVFAIYDRSDQEAAARDALRAIRVPEATLKPGDLISIISRWKSASVRWRDASAKAETDKEHLAAMAYRRYQEKLKGAGAVDFDDLLLLTEELFAKFADVRKAEAGRFDHVLIDEYQDTNESQYRIVKALAVAHGNLCVVGDDDQSIYGWRGAEVAHILRFKLDWPTAKVVRLEDNYRSTSAIIELANRLIVFNSERHEKRLIAARQGGERPQIWQAKDEEHEAEMVVADIKRRMTEPGTEPRDFAILFRTNEQPRLFEQELRKEKLPYLLIGGMSFFDRREIRDVLAYLKVIANPRDEVSLRRILNTPTRGIGQGSIESLGEEAVKRGVSLWEVLGEVEKNASVNAKATAAIQNFRELINRYRHQASQGNLTDLAKRLLAEIDYQGHIDRTYDKPADRESRWNIVSEVINALARYEEREEEPDLSGFLSEMLLADRDQEEDKESQLRRNAIVLMTLHSAKGLEYPQVYLVGLEEGILPHHRAVAAGDKSIEEERRLCYVGVTRAQDRLTISMALTRMKWGKARDSIPSRYLFELTGTQDESRPVSASMSNKEIAAKLSAGRKAPKPKGKKRAAKGAGKGTSAAGRATPSKATPPTKKPNRPAK